MTETRFRRWHSAGYTSELLPIIPPGAEITEGSKVRPEHLGKVPGSLTAAGTWSGLGGRWPEELHATLAQVKQWHAWGAGVGLQTRKFHAIDIDVSDPVLADKISALAFKIFGEGPVRGRDNSARRLHLCRLEKQEEW